jgi:hypothetical protein
VLSASFIVKEISMSSQIHFEQIAIRLTERQSPSSWGGNKLILMVNGGAGNCIRQDGHVARHWYVTSYGNEIDVMQEVIVDSAGCEGGGLMMDSPSRSVRPEAYIRRWRQRIAESWTLDFALAAGFTFSFRIDLHASCIAAAMAADHSTERLGRLREQCPPISLTTDEFGDPCAVQRHPFNMHDPELMAQFNDLHDLGRGPWSRKIKVAHCIFNPAAWTRGALKKRVPPIQQAGANPTAAHLQPEGAWS